MTEVYRPPDKFRLPWALPIAKLPSASRYPGQMIWVTDMHQDFAGVPLPGWAISDGGVWRPLRHNAVTRWAAAGGVKPWMALKHRPTIIVTGTLTAAASVAPEIAGAANGDDLMVIRQAGGVGVLSLLGKAVAIGGALRAVFDGTTWQPVPTTGLL